MDNELIDFFDKNGKFVLTAPISAKHAENSKLFIKSVHIFILNDKKEILIQRINEDHSKLNRWEIPSGHVSSKERCEEAAKRELKEETGIITALKHLRAIKIEALHEFVSYHIGNSNIIPDAAGNQEADAFEFISLERLNQEIKLNTRLFSPQLILFLKDKSALQLPQLS